MLEREHADSPPSAVAQDLSKISSVASSSFEKDVKVRTGNVCGPAAHLACPAQRGTRQPPLLGSLTAGDAPVVARRRSS